MSAAISGEEYTIGYIDSGHGHDDGLSEISLQNFDGTFQTSTEAIARGGVQQAAEAALADGVMPSDPTFDFSAVSLHNMAGEFTWPIVAISYIYMRANQTMTHETGPLLKAFVEYVISDEGQALLQNYNFEGVPNDVKDVAQMALDYLELDPDSSVWIFESGDETQPGIGQQDYVISGKRRAHDEYAIGELEDEKADSVLVSAIAADLAALTTDLASLNDVVAAVAASDGGSCDCDDDDNNNKAKKARDLALAGLLVAILGLLVGGTGIAMAIMANRRVDRLFDSRAQQKEICIPEMKPSAKAYADLQPQNNEAKANEQL